MTEASCESHNDRRGPSGCRGPSTRTEVLARDDISCRGQKDCVSTCAASPPPRRVHKWPGTPAAQLGRFPPFPALRDPTFGRAPSRECKCPRASPALRDGTRKPSDSSLGKRFGQVNRVPQRGGLPPFMRNLSGQSTHNVGGVARPKPPESIRAWGAWWFGAESVW